MTTRGRGGFWPVWTREITMADSKIVFSTMSTVVGVGFIVQSNKQHSEHTADSYQRKRIFSVFKEKCHIQQKEVTDL